MKKERLNEILQKIKKSQNLGEIADLYKEADIDFSHIIKFKNLGID